MGLFKIDFNQFKPSNSLVKPIVPTTTQPISSPVPVRQSSPAPAPQPVQQMQSIPQPKKSGLQKVFDVLSYPSKLTEKVLTGGKGYEKVLQNPTIQKVMAASTPGGLIDPLGINKKYYESPTGQKVQSEINRFTLDPLNILPFGKGGELLSKAGEFISKATGLGKVGTKISEFAKTTPLIYKTIEKVNPYFRIPEFGKVVQTAEQTTGTRINQLYRELKGMVTGLKPEDQVHIGEIIEGIATPKNTQAAELAARVTDISKKIGQEAVDTGLMPKKVFEEMTSKGYLSHIFTNETKNIPSTVRGVPKVIGNMFKKRTGAEGYVKEFAPAVYKGLGSEIKDIESAKMFKTVADKFGQKIGKGQEAVEGFIRASDMGIEGRGFAKAFRGVQIPQAVAEYLTNVRKVNPNTWYDKLLNVWKAGKTIWNPAYHVRNVMSNQILSSMGTGKNLISTTSNYIKAVKEYKAGTSSLFKVAQDAGLVGRKTFGTGLNELLDTAGLGKQNWLQKLANKPRELQNLTEETSKLNVFKSLMEKSAGDAGITLENALKNNDLVAKAVDKTEEAIFSPYRIGAAERNLVGRNIPFYSFTRQALPFTAKTLVNNPKSIAVFGKIKSAIEGLSQDPNIQLPDYLQNQIRVGAADKNGNPTYFDPTYIYPFGNFVESGLGKKQLPFGLSFNPFAMEVIQQLANQDFYFGNQISKSNIPIKALGERLAHLYRTASPAVLTTLTNTIYPALVAKKDSMGRTRNVGQAILSALGIKLSKPDMQNIQLQSLRSESSKTSSIQQEMDQVLNDPNLTRSQKDEQIKQLRSLTP
jgi:hypothetical protein